MARLLGIAIVLPGLLLLVFALRALDQERRIARQHLKERLERAADLAVRAINQQTEHWRQFQDVGVLVSRERREGIPVNALSYDLNPAIASETTLPSLATGEVYELRYNDLSRAADAYTAVLEKTDAEHKPHVLHRLARTYAKMGARRRASELYNAMLVFPPVRIGFVPSDLIARYQICALDARDCAALYRDLIAGLWRLPKEQYTFYADAASTYAGAADVRHDEARRHVTAAAQNWLANPSRVPLPGYIAFWDDATGLIAPAAAIKAKLERSASLDPDLHVALVPIGRRERRDGSDDASVQRPLAASALPWQLMVSLSDLNSLEAEIARRQRMYLFMLLLAFGTLISGAFLNVRTLRREREIARLKSDFVSTVSHEFRSPLTAIRQLSELLMRGRVPNEERRQHYYGLIATESDRLSRLVENLLDFSRMEHGRKQYHFEQLDVVPWLLGTAEAAAYSSVQTRFADHVPSIAGDRSALTSAVTNLLDNAIKYSPQGRPVLLTAEAADGTVTIAVTDYGYGVADEDKPHIFKKFYRARGDIARQVKGAGLGLCLVKEIVETHGGRVEFDSTAGVGSTFRIHLKAAM
jgi:signal transduction histidine kinase